MARDAALQHEQTIRAWLKRIPVGERAAALAAAADGHGLRVRRAEQRGGRRNRGTWYTPPELVDAVLERALTRRTCTRGTVCDPACGGGHFLVAAGRRMIAAGRAPAQLSGALLGTDLNARAVALTRVRLQHEFGGTTAQWRKAVRCADALRMETWRPYARTIDAVVGNPPFLSPLKQRSARTPVEAKALKDVFGDAMLRYTNIAATFLMLGLQLARLRGTVALVLPLSTCAASDAAAARAIASDLACMECCLLPPVRIFGGGVPTMIPVLRCGAKLRKVQVVGICGGTPAQLYELPWLGSLSAGHWGVIVAQAQGIPPVASARGSGSISDHAAATADFRQHFYGLKGKVKEEPKSKGGAGAGGRRRANGSGSAEWAPVVTVGVIDAARNLWGTRSLKLHGRTYLRPVANLTTLRREPELQRWVVARLQPKVVLATQTSAIEAWVDATGSWLPSTPLISVYPRDGFCIWKLGAALLAPPVAAIAWQRHGGGALAPTALKLSASQVAALPLPSNKRAWQRAAELLKELHSASLGSVARANVRQRFAAAACDAYGVVDQPERDALLTWWNAAVAERQATRAGA